MRETSSLDAGALTLNEVGRMTQDRRSLRPERSKRWLDVVGAAGALVLFAPLMLLLALLVRLDGGPAMFAHRRVGRYGRPFPCLKFRTMVVDAEARLQAILAGDPQARAQWERERKLHADPRITRLGAFMRTTSLDELPQLINVLRGEMSLVGPRPIVEAELARYGDDAAHYLVCRPGITGLWQVQGRNDVDYATRVRLDRIYASRRTLRMDLEILARTVGVVINRKGAY